MILILAKELGMNLIKNTKLWAFILSGVSGLIVASGNGKLLFNGAKAIALVLGGVTSANFLTDGGVAATSAMNFTPEQLTVIGKALLSQTNPALSNLPLNQVLPVVTGMMTPSVGVTAATAAMVGGAKVFGTQVMNSSSATATVTTLKSLGVTPINVGIFGISGFGFLKYVSPTTFEHLQKIPEAYNKAHADMKIGTGFSKSLYAISESVSTSMTREDMMWIGGAVVFAVGVYTTWVLLKTKVFSWVPGKEIINE